MAADRLTQLQDAVNLQAENFCNSIGALQAFAKESPFPEFSNSEDSNDECTETNSSNTTVDPFNSKLSLNDVSSSLLNAANTLSNAINNSSSTNSSQPTLTDSNSNDEKIIKSTINDSNDNSTQSTIITVPEDYSQYFARLVARTAKDIDTLVESLPNISETDPSSSDVYSDSIKQIEEENAEAVEKLEKAIEQGESVLNKIREAIDDIGNMLSQRI